MTRQEQSLPKRTLRITANAFGADPSQIPERSGVYLFYIAGGLRLLERTGYFDTDNRVPQERQGRLHLYTGAANDLRLRMKQHFERDWRSSTFRKSLLTIEYKRKAISKSRTDHCNVTDEASLTQWLRLNVTVEFQFTDEPFKREFNIIERCASPMNITWRRNHLYSRMLMAWRNEVFPPWRPGCHR